MRDRGTTLPRCRQKVPQDMRRHHILGLDGRRVVHVHIGDVLRKALVVVTEGSTATEADLIAWCKSKAAGYKAPTSIEFRDELARTATGKLQKFKLRAPYWEGRERQVN